MILPICRSRCQRWRRTAFFLSQLRIDQETQSSVQQTVQPSRRWHRERTGGKEMEKHSVNVKIGGEQRHEFLLRIHLAERIFLAVIKAHNLAHVITGEDR